MKLHLNLTLRRAVLAAMAMVAVGTTQADNIVTDKNTSGKDVYIVGDGTMDTAAWEQLWTDAPDAGTVTIGTHAGAADVTLADGTYSAPKVYIAGVGNNSGGTVANDGSLNVGAATLNVEELSVGQSLVGGKGTLIVNGGALNVGTGLYVGAYEGEGEVEATDATITVEGGAEGAVFAVGYRESVQVGEDKATLSGGSITVGAEGGVVDTTIVGRGSGKDELYLQDGNIATFHDQTVVGELAGSNGIIYVSGSESKLSMDNTVLGVAQGASGTICVEGGSSAESSHLVIGQAGEGCVEVEDGASLTATTILAGEKATGEGVLDVEDAAVTAGNIMVGVAGTGGLSIDDAGTVTTDALVLGSKAGADGSAEIYDGTLNATQTLHVGDAGSGSMSVYGGEVVAGTIVLGSQVTGSGTLEISTATFGEGDEAVEYKGGKVSAAALYVGYQGTGEVVVDDEEAELKAETAYVIGTDSKLDTQAGSTTLTNAVVLGGTLSTGAGASTTVSDELILDSAANLTSAGTTTLNQATVHEGSSLEVTGGTLTVGTLVSEGDIANDGEIIVNSSMETITVTGTGDVKVNEGASWTIGGKTEAGTLSGAGTTTILVNVGTIGAAGGDAIVDLTTLDSSVEAYIDTTEATSLVGKQVDFLSEGDSLTEVKLTVADGVSISTNTSGGGYIVYGTTESGSDKCLHFIGDAVKSDAGVTASGLVFTELSVRQGNYVESYNAADTATETLVKDKDNGDGSKTETKIDGDALSMDDKVTTSAVAGVAGEDKTNVIIGKGVENESGSSTPQAKMLSVDKYDDTTDSYTHVDSTGVALVFGAGQSSSLAGSGAEESCLGFAEGSGGTVTKTTTAADGSTETVKEEIKLVDVIEMEQGATVELKDMSVHSTHALTVSGTSDAKVTLTLSGVDMTVGGSVDGGLFDTYTDAGNEQTVESDHHLIVDSVIENAEITLAEGTSLSFAKVTDEETKETLGSVLFEDCVITSQEGTVLGSTDENMDQLKLVNTEVYGTGTLSNFSMQGGVLMAGNSPGVKTLVGSTGGETTTLNGTRMGVYFISGVSGSWSANGANTDATTTHSMFKIEGAITLNNVEFFVGYEEASGGGYIASDKDAFDVEFEDGASITLIEGYQNLTGTYSFDEDTLPELSDGLFWDTTQLLTTGKIFVYGEILEEPGRIANTMVSAGETVLNFGRLAESQAALRKAGTTRTWGSALAVFDSVDSGADTNGYDYDAWGAAVGVDHAFTKNTVIGAAFGCTWGENSPEHGTAFYEAGSIDQDSKMVALYGVHKFQTKGLLNDVKLNAFAAYGWFSNDSTRNAIKGDNTATAEWDSQAWVVSASLSRDITTDNGVVFTPYVGVEYTKASMDDFSEQGRSYAADYTADEDYSNLSVKVGVTVSKNFDGFTPYFGIAYINDVDRSAAQVTATGKREAVTAESALPGRNALQLRLGATWKVSESVDLNAAYTAELRDKATEQRANVGIGITF